MVNDIDLKSDRSELIGRVKITGKMQLLEIYSMGSVLM